MKNLALSPLAENNSTDKQSTVMETIMKPLSYARRGARWLMAAGITRSPCSPLWQASRKTPFRSPRN